MPDANSLAGRFRRSATRFPQRPALEVDGQSVTYGELEMLAARIAATIQRHGDDRRPLAAVLAHRSLAAYAGVLGVLGSGKGYVPLHPHFPPARTRTMLAASGCRALLVGEEALDALPQILKGVTEPLTIIAPFVPSMDGLAAIFDRHRFIAAAELARESDWTGPPPVDRHATAYLLFTSGSTGVPKGVPVRQDNVAAYLDHVCEAYGVRETDRFSQTFDLTFDLSVHDLFVCWSAGACLCCLPQASLIGPAKFIRENELTMWFSVPSLGLLMQRLRLLKPDALPSLRYSLFCGEALPAALASAWQIAAPNSTVENLYGPTEATIAILRYRWDEQRSPAETINGIVPIGEPFAGQRACVVSDTQQRLSDGASGELCLSGSQVVTGYLDDPGKTREQFLVLPDEPGVTWYRTGDLARHDATVGFRYLGRSDSQVKIRGWRVELQEVEQAVRRAARTEMAICIAWPERDGSAEGIVAFVAGPTSGPDEAQIVAACRQSLPDYMVPANVHRLDALPLNASGKVDRGALAAMLREGAVL